MKCVPPLNYVKVRVVHNRPPLIKTRHVASLPSSIKVREKQPASTNKNCVEETAAATSPPTVYHNDQEEVLFTNDDHFDSPQEIEEEEQPVTKKRCIEKESFIPKNLDKDSIAKESEHSLQEVDVVHLKQQRIDILGNWEDLYRSATYAPTQEDKQEEQTNDTTIHEQQLCHDFIHQLPSPTNVVNAPPPLYLLSRNRLETIVLFKEGQEGQLGISLLEGNGGQIVVFDAVMPQSQADKCGVRAGDIPVYNSTMSSINSSGLRPIPYVVFLQRVRDKRDFTFNVLRNRNEYTPPTAHVPKQCTAKTLYWHKIYRQNQIMMAQSKKKVDKSTATDVCPGYPVVGNTESQIGLMEGEHIPCYNKPMDRTSMPTTRCQGRYSGLCYTCYRRSVNDWPVYSIEYQLYRSLLKLGHPLILRRRFDTQLGAIYADYSYEYKGHLIIIEQDEGDEGLGHNSGYPVDKELAGLEKRLSTGGNGKSTLVIRNSPGDNHIQDPRQVVLIDALINKFKECVDMRHECVRKSMAIFVDSRDQKEYEEHLRTGTIKTWTIKTNPHLTSARKKLDDVVHSVHSRDPSKVRDGNARDVPNFVDEALNKIFRD